MSATGERVFLGRERELRELAAHMAAARPVVVLGEVGAGKTTLVRHAVRRAGLALVEAGGLATMASEPYAALARLLGPTVGPDSDPLDVLARVGARVRSGILLLDDLQWADAATRDLLVDLAPAVALVTAIRTCEPGTPRALAAAQRVGCELVALDALSLEASVGVLHDRHGARSGRNAWRQRAGLDADALAAKAGGNPLLLHEIDKSGGLSPLGALTVQRRLAALSTAARRGTALLSLAGGPLPDTALDADVAAELAAAGIAERADTRIRLHHGTLGEAALAACADSETRELHADLARCLPDEGEAARHHLAAGERRAALRRALAAAEAATVSGTRAELLALAAASAEGEEGDELRVRAGGALVDAGSFEAAESLLDSETWSDPATEARGDVVRARARRQQLAAADARALIDKLLSRLDELDADTKARVRIEDAYLEVWFGTSPADAAARAEVALAHLPRALAAHTGLVRALAMLRAGDAAGGAVLEDAARLALGEGDFEVAYDAFLTAVMTRSIVSDLKGGRDMALAQTAQALRSGHAGWGERFRVAVAWCDLLAGRYDDVVAAASPLAEAGSDRTAAECAQLYLAVVLTDTGEAEAALARLQAIPSSEDAYLSTALTWAKGEAAFLAGQPGKAAAHAADGLAEAPTEEFVPLLARTMAWVELDRGMVARGPSPTMWVLPFTAGVPDEVAGVALLAEADPPRARDAAACFERAADAWSGRFERHRWWCEWAAGEALRRAGDRGAPDRLEDVATRATEAGMHAVAARATASLSALGRRPPHPVRGEGPLTAREREALALVLRGFTYAQIAAELGITTHTVSHHLRSARTKLDTSSTLQAAVVAART